MSSEERLRFWMVWNQGTPTTRYRHSTKAEAVREAERLSQQNPGDTFFVLKATVAMVADVPTVRRLRLIEEEIPF